MLKPSYRRKEDKKKRKIKRSLFSHIKEQEIRKSMRLNSKLKESKMKKKEKFKDLENFKRKLLIGKQKLMHLEQKEHLKRVRDKPENVKD